MSITLHQFVEKTELLLQKELDRVKLLAFYFQNEQDSFEFTIDMVCDWFTTLGLHQLNKSRLKQNLIKSRSFIRGKVRDSFSLHINETYVLKQKFLFISEDDEKIVSIDTILPVSLYESTRGYIESLSKQINASYEYNIFDGCAVLMRRLLEICLIHSYENLRIDGTIKDLAGNYKFLSDIVADAKTNSKLSLSRNTKLCLDDFRTLGNFSAHKIYYGARKSDIRKVILEYRVTIEELLYKSGIKK